MSSSAAVLQQALTDAARALGDVELVTTANGTEFRAGNRAFAAVSAGTAEFALDRVVARAARATPMTSQSARGADWVAFSPLELDRFARDRAVAWFGSAYRRAASRGA